MSWTEVWRTTMKTEYYEKVVTERNMIDHLTDGQFVPKQFIGTLKRERLRVYGELEYEDVFAAVHRIKWCWEEPTYPLLPYTSNCPQLNSSGSIWTEMER